MSSVDAEAFMDAIEGFGRQKTDLPPAATARERAMFPYAMTLTLRPAETTQEALRPMREAGLDDTAILEANQVIAYFAYVNRVVDGLGVQLEPHRQP